MPSTTALLELLSWSAFVIFVTQSWCTFQIRRHTTPSFEFLFRGEVHAPTNSAYTDQPPQTKEGIAVHDAEAAHTPAFHSIAYPSWLRVAPISLLSELRLINAGFFIHCPFVSLIAPRGRRCDDDKKAERVSSGSVTRSGWRLTGLDISGITLR